MRERRRGATVFVAGIVLACVAGSTQQGGFVLPLARRNGGILARGLLRNATIPLHGAVKDYGYFYATIHLGTPPRPFAVIVDTGSTITYVPCAACGNACGPHHKDAAFDPALSKTAKQIPCSSDLCSCGRPQCTCDDGRCFYARTYAEQSSSAGILLQDNMVLGEGPVGVVFGCEMRETGEIYQQEADGILGLGNAEISLVNQLATRGIISDVFSLCFGSVEGDGAFMVGDVDLLPHNVVLQYTPLVESSAHPHYYGVTLDVLAVGKKALVVDKALYQQGYGAVLDSGTTFTYLPTQAFTSFTQEVSKYALAHGLRSVKGPDKNFPDICFGGAPLDPLGEEMETVFPTVTLTFAGGVSLETPPLNYLFMHSMEKGAYCIGVFDNGAAGTLLGGITFRNILVQYDRRARRVGFGYAQCQAIGQESRTAPCHHEGSSLSSGTQCAPPSDAAKALSSSKITSTPVSAPATTRGANPNPTALSAAPDLSGGLGGSPANPTWLRNQKIVIGFVVALSVFCLSLIIFQLVRRRRAGGVAGASGGSGPPPRRRWWGWGGAAAYRGFEPSGEQQLMPRAHSGDGALLDGVTMSNGSQTNGSGGSLAAAEAGKGGVLGKAATANGKAADDGPALPGTMIDIPLH